MHTLIPKYILNVRIDDINLITAIEVLHELIASNKPHIITTPNPEIILKASEDAKLLKIINSSSLNIPDGFGLKLTSTLNSKLFKSEKISNRLTGIDFANAIISESKKTGIKLFFLGASDFVNKTATSIAKSNGANIVGSSSANPDCKTIFSEIDDSNADVTFVAYGCPKQEYFMHKAIQQCKKPRIYIGLGGTLDFISGKTKRAPKIISKLGLEWLFRLINEPRRLKRIFNATIVFPIKVLFDKLKTPTRS